MYIASGENYPDALSAGPAAVASGGVLLLVPSAGVPTAIADALVASNPTRVVICGGPASIPEAVRTELQRLVPTAIVSRVSGADRYAVSQVLAARSFPGGADLVFAATGTGFADALSAGAAAGALKAPVLLVDGPASGVDANTSAALRSLGPDSIAVMGGLTSVSSAVETALASVAPVTRVAGADRYQVSLALNRLVLSDYSTVYLASGASFPDALAGAVLAGTQRHPLFVVPQTCVPRGVLDLLPKSGPASVVLLGGPASLSPAVEALTPCP